MGCHTWLFGGQGFLQDGDSWLTGILADGDSWQTGIPVGQGFLADGDSC